MFKNNFYFIILYDGGYLNKVREFSRPSNYFNIQYKVQLKKTQTKNTQHLSQNLNPDPCYFLTLSEKKLNLLHNFLDFLIKKELLKLER